jgi:small-conductance mechanosensitive channel
VDRIRVLNDQTDKLCRGATDLDFLEDRLAHVQDQLDRLVWRGDRIRYALTALYLAFGAFTGTSLTLAIDVWFNNLLRALPTSLAVAGVGFMLFACVNLVREAMEALRSNRLEIRFYRELHERRKASDRGCATG